MYFVFLFCGFLHELFFIIDFKDRGREKEREEERERERAQERDINVRG